MSLIRQGDRLTRSWPAERFGRECAELEDRSSAPALEPASTLTPVLTPRQEHDEPTQETGRRRVRGTDLRRDDDRADRERRRGAHPATRPGRVGGPDPDGPFAAGTGRALPTSALPPRRSRRSRPARLQLYEPEERGGVPPDRLGRARPTMPPRSSGMPTPGSCSRPKVEETSTVTVMMVARKGGTSTMSSRPCARPAARSDRSPRSWATSGPPCPPTACRPRRDVGRQGDRPQPHLPHPRSRSGHGGASRRRPRADAGPSAPGREHARREPVHAHRRDRRRRLRDDESEVGRPRHRRRRAGHGCRRRAPGTAEDHGRQAQDRRLGDRDRSDPGRGRHVGRDVDRAQRTLVPLGRRRLDRARRRLPASATSTSTRRRAATSRGDLNGNGDVWDAFGVLYEPSTHRIWVDADGNHDFTDAPGDDAVRRSTTRWATSAPTTRLRPRTNGSPSSWSTATTSTSRLSASVGETGTFVNIGLPAASHGTHVAGIVAATSMFGGEMHGAAPGAQIVSSRACTFAGGCTQAALTEGMIDLVSTAASTSSTCRSAGCRRSTTAPT